MLNKEQLIELLINANIDFELEQENPSIIYDNGQSESYEHTQMPSVYFSKLDQNTIPMIKTKVNLDQSKFEFSITPKLNNSFNNFKFKNIGLLGDAA